MERVLEKDRCTGCHACYNICPKGAITMEVDDKGFKYPVIIKEKCIDCGMCRKVCPVLNNVEKENEISCYAIYNKNEAERINSSSGGIFTLLAQEIIRRSGVVYGAAFDKEFNVYHKRITKKEEIIELMGSKYVQSVIGNTYKEVKKDLLDKKDVLFTGTPCQIEGLKSYLQRDYENLYTQDIICHGVPSPKVWDNYKKYREKVDNGTPKSISFRNKDNGWAHFNMKFTYDEKEYKNNQNTDLYMKAFLRNASLRDSCYNCSFKKKNRNSDITLADFWGIDNVMPEMNDNKGVSMVILNSKKGKELFDLVKDKCEYRECVFEDVIKYNMSMVRSVKCDRKREMFFNSLEKMDFEELVDKNTTKKSFASRVKGKIVRTLRKIVK